MNEQTKIEKTESGESNKRTILSEPEVKLQTQGLTPAQRHKEEKEPRTFLAPLPGFVWNPLRKLPPNMPCPCRSLKKFKKCCLGNLPPAVPAALAKRYEEQIALGNLVFLTEKNADKLKEGMPPELWAEKAKELEAQRKEREAPARLLIKDAWECAICKCTNAGELAKCADCGKDKPEGVKTNVADHAQPVTG